MKPTIHWKDKMNSLLQNSQHMIEKEIHVFKVVVFFATPKNLKKFNHFPYYGLNNPVLIARDSLKIGQNYSMHFFHPYEFQPTKITAEVQDQ